MSIFLYSEKKLKYPDVQFLENSSVTWPVSILGLLQLIENMDINKCFQKKASKLLWSR